MKKYIHYIFCILCIGFFTGCMLEEEAVENMDDNLVHMIFTAMVEDGDAVTKTLLDENEVAGVRSVLWSPGDEIGIATYGGTYYQFKNTLEEPAANGVFEGSVSQDNKYYSIYPYKKDQKMSTSVSVTIPTQQTYKPNSFDGSAAPMVGKGNQAEPLHFMNLCGALAVQLTGNEKVRSIIFQTTSGEKVSGEGTVDPDYGDYPVLQMGDVADNFIILDCGEGVQLSGTPTSFHFVLPPGTYNGFKLIISTTDGQFMEKSTDKQLTIKRSIVTKAASLAFENNVKDFTDLSERGNANSYIVSQSGNYSFDATVIGNGEFGFTPDHNFHTNSPEISPSYVDVLWEDSLGLIKGCGYDSTSGEAKFITSGKEGNAVLAAKDADGTIIWSWHIWMTDQPEEQIYNNDAGIMMDRNLGAISATPGDVSALGLLYQWGRKDPFLGSAKITSSQESTTSTIVWPAAVQADVSVGTIAYSVMNPTTFIKNNGTNHDWYYTGTTSTDNTRWQPAKTIYDPCPSGWRVPDGGKEGIWAIALGLSSQASGYLYDSNTQSLDLSGKLSDVATVLYPATGYRTSNHGSLYAVADRGYCWSVTPYNNEAYSFDFYDSGTIHPAYSTYRAYGFSVRCMKDDGYVDISYPQVSITGFEDVTTSSVTLKAYIKSEGVSSVTEKGFIYGLMPDLSDGTKIQCGEGGGEFSYTLSGLANATKYYAKAYAINSRGETQSVTKLVITKYTEETIELSAKGTSNCYQVVPLSATYGFDCSVKGNTTISVGNIATLEVVWETDSYMRKAESGTIISSVALSNSMALFTLSDNLNEGNALIAAKDENGTILWSWHIWVTDTPVEHLYISGNDRFIVQDRHLGATRGDNGNGEEWKESCGIDYQWGRKDPFSAGNFTSTKETFSIEQSVQNPTIKANWSRESGLWSSQMKTMYDPCPVGYRVAPHEVYKCLQYTEELSDNGEFFLYDGVNTAWYPFRGNPTEGGSIEYWGDNYMWDSSRTDKMIRYASNYIALNQVGMSSNSNCPIRCVKDDSLNEDSFSTIGSMSLSDAGTANSYIVSSAGTYSISSVKGNSNESVGTVASAEVLWESFGTDGYIFKGNLISDIKYENGQIYFKTPDSYREGNAVIAAKDVSGTILWSWHIWLTDQPEEQEYYNNAGTMMDRNLGATSATPGDVGTLGLLYQWGRKDPFLGSSSISGGVERVSTITWPSPVSSDYSNGTIEYSVMNPTTFITSVDWYYTESSSTDNTRWQSEKTIYDPCPPGWRVPDAGDEGVWATVIGKSSTVSGYAYDNTNEGLNFAQNFGNASTIWYPASGGLANNSGNLVNVGYKGDYWSCTPCQNSKEARKFSFSDGGSVYPSTTSTRASGCVVRCFKQGTGSDMNYDNDFLISGAESLSDSGTANSYIVSSSGTYSIPTVKGNSSESVGDVESTEVLWESFGTDLRPLRGDLVKGTRYENGVIYFKTNDEYKEGNAVIVAKDASGTILWSWHIWFTDQPQEQVYFNNAGTMMDRNLGAISATPGDVGALGLLYQWGRKDPFLGSMSISSSAEPKSTITWPSYVLSNSTNGTIEYTISNPTTFIKYNSSNVDWYYTGSNSTDNTRWQSEKTIYDPCPVGWRVPDGGDNGVWATALGSSSNYTDTFDTSSKGIDFSGKFGSDETIWYPASGYRHRDGSGLDNVGSYGYCWTVTPYNSTSVYELEFNKNDSVQPSNGSGRAFGRGVRCFKVTD